MRIALVTCEQFRDEAAEDLLLADALIQLGHHADRPAWENSAVNWSHYDALIIRSTWDYQYRFPEFLNWIDQIEQAGIPLYNPPVVLRWNSNKNYLRELAAKGVPFPATEWIQPGSKVDLAAVMDKHGWQKAVVKPIIGAGGFFTFLIDRANAATHEANSLPEFAARGVMIQEFLPEIMRDGEWSFLFFDGEFSHAVIKKPIGTEFRVQSRYGGVYSNAAASAEHIAQTRSILQHAPSKLLYARVDGIIRNGQFILGELEVFEPSLFLEFGVNTAAKVAKRFSEALA